MAPGNMLRLIRLVNKHIPLPFGSARNSRDFINVKNLVEFIHLAVEKEVEGVFYPTDKVPYSTRNVVEEISRQLGVHTINLPSPSIFLKLIEKVRPDLYQKLWGDVVIDRQLALALSVTSLVTLWRMEFERWLNRLSDRNDKLDLWICSPASFRAGEHLF